MRINFLSLSNRLITLVATMVLLATITITMTFPGLRSARVDGNQVTIVIDAVEAGNPAPGDPDDPTGQKCVKFDGTTKIGGIKGALQFANQPGTTYARMRVFESGPLGEKSVMRILSDGQVILGYRAPGFTGWTFRTFADAESVLRTIGEVTIGRNASAKDIIFRLITGDGSRPLTWTTVQDEILKNLRGWNGSCN